MSAMCVPMVICQHICDCPISATIVASGVYLRIDNIRPGLDTEFSAL